MPKIEGIGGVFIYSEDAKRLANWYQETFELEMERHPTEEAYYVVFFTRDFHTSQVRENPVFAIRQVDEEHPALNAGLQLGFRVNDFERTLDELREKGIHVEDDILVWERGKHGQIIDLDGNRIEMYEEIFPADSE